jgi:hypothetical protein
LALASIAIIWITIVLYPNLFWQKYFPATRVISWVGSHYYTSSSVSSLTIFVLPP